MSVITSDRIQFPAQLSVAAPFSGADQLLGVTTQETIWICYDNQSDVDVDLYVDGVLWKTFEAGEALVDDCNSNKGNAPVVPIPTGTRFSCLGTAGTGAFRISLKYKV
jgi:hypothetical protein